MNRKRLTTLVVSCIAAFGLQAENVNISTKTTSLVVDATKGQDLRFMYYGAKLSDKDIATHCETGGWKGQWNHFSAYPAYGVNCDQEYALSVVHANGDMALELRLEEVEKQGSFGAGL